MKRWTWCSFLSELKPGFYLLLAASVLLFAGALIVDCHSEEFRTLNFMLLYKWLVLFHDRPVLYVWMFVLFAILFALGVNTCCCTWLYMKKSIRSGVSVKKAGIVLFHVSFLFFLSGHLVYEVTGSSETLLLKKGEVSHHSKTELCLKTLTLQRRHVDLAGKKLPMGTSTSITVTDPSGKVETIYPESMKPAFAMGYSFHVCMNEQGLSDEQIRLIIRRSPALCIFIAGAAGIIVAFLLFMLGTRRIRLE